ncbi:hypothetical protein N7448_009219 [Penicillium atrosanguineum]|uniref:Uncharacterized protein n=1 Tax=Penicillium atrosanguineum TaxID=1132637 RepID=A0A9W9GL95_9EURO|nr:hypothetical protein N7448_009219 [Penicillium atrosanguineum]KAJ5141753.1 hypothetical protein N7526_002748 [Penicillium atrosanguineum]KAJ5321384.1 hypothetical protein N7476_004386 [Penicillium atrosanguineum]
MSSLTHGGRIVPILTGHQQQPPDSTTTPETATLETRPSPSSIHTSSLLVQPDESATMRHKRAIDLASLEMACLKERDLFALPTEGDGNCLYYSLSDQLWGNFDHDNEIRQLLADHIEMNKEYFMQFVVAEGGERRRPKRAAQSAYATRSADVSAPSEEDKERRFEAMVNFTRKNGEWGSSEHLQAFCQVFKVDINVYTMDGVQAFRDVNASHEEHRNVIHVAFHDFKHYSSVRSIDGTHKGLFTIQKSADQVPLREFGEDSKEQVSDNKRPIYMKIPDFTAETAHSSASSSSSDIPLPTTTTTTATTPETTLNDAGLAVDVFPPWDIQSIQEGLGGRYDRDTIVDMLQRCRGDIDRAFAALLDAVPEKKPIPGPSFNSSIQVSRESSPFSTGSKRSAEDSEDSDDPRPAVRRVRPKRHIVSNLTLGVDISFRDDQNELVSLNLHMKAEADAEKARAESSTDDAQESSDQSASDSRRGPRRSGRLSKSRPI